MRKKITIAIIGLIICSAGLFAIIKMRKAPDSAPEPAPPFETVDENYDDLDGKTPEDLECVAGVFHDRLFANDEQYYRNIETRFGKQITSQTAWIKNHDLSVEASAGGCSHYGYSFDFSNIGKDGDTQQEVLLEAVALLKELPLTPQGQNARKAVIDPMAKQEFRIAPDGLCNFVETEGYSWTECSIAKKEGGSFTVHLLYTVAL